MKELDVLAHLDKQRRHFQDLANFAETREWQLVFENYVQFYADLIVRVSVRKEPPSTRPMFLDRRGAIDVRQVAAASSAAHF